MSLCEHHGTHTRPDGTADLGCMYGLLLLGYEPVSHVTVVDAVGNYNMMVSIYISNHF